MKVEGIQSTRMGNDAAIPVPRPVKQSNLSAGNGNVTDIGSTDAVETQIISAGASKQESEDKDFMSSDRSMINDEIMQKALEKANKELIKVDRRIELSVHPKTHTIMYKVCDSETGEVISEFPPEKIQDMIAKIWELAGLFVDEKL